MGAKEFSLQLPRTANGAAGAAHNAAGHDLAAAQGYAFAGVAVADGVAKPGKHPGGIVHKGDADLGGCCEMLIFQHSIAGTADQDTEAGRNLHGLLGIGNQNFIGHTCPLPSFYAASTLGRVCGRFVGFNDLLNQTVTHNVLFGKVALRDAVHIFQDLQRVHKAAAGTVG